MDYEKLLTLALNAGAGVLLAVVVVILWHNDWKKRTADEKEWKSVLVALVTNATTAMVSLKSSIDEQRRTNDAVAATTTATLDDLKGAIDDLRIDLARRRRGET